MGTVEGGGTPTLALERVGHAAWIRFERPERLNALNGQMLGELLDAVEEVAADETVRVLVLHGSGRGFSAGGDLTEGAGAGVLDGYPQEGRAARLRELMRTSELIRRMPAITIAAVHGPCAGAGLSIAAAADLRFAQRGASFSTAFLNAGLSGDYGGTWLLSRLLGGARARELYLRPTPISAERAAEIGLVSEVVDDVVGAVEEVVRELSAAPATALALMKQNLVDADDGSFELVLDREVHRHMISLAHPDALEASRAFIQKRRPVFDS